MRVGDKVTITHGPFKGKTGVVMSLRNGWAKVGLGIVMASVSVLCLKPTAKEQP